MTVNIGVIVILVAYTFIFQISVESSNGTQRLASKELERVKFPENAHQKSNRHKSARGLNKTSQLPTSPGKNSVIEGKARHAKVNSHFRNGSKDVTLRKPQNERLQQKSPGSKKFNTTADKGKLVKPNLRAGKQDQWPKLQKRRLRENTDDKLSTRFTKMNMMQMDDPATTTALVNNPLAASQQDGDINEMLSPYTIKEQMTRIAAKFTNVNTTIEVIGRTLEYNDIVLMKMTRASRTDARLRVDDTKKYVDDTGEKKIIFIVHGLSVMGIAAVDALSQEKEFVRLVSYYLEHLDLFDILLIPMANPDGFGYRTEMWNKNLSPQNACPGVALDRNFDIAWNSTRATSSCSQQYPGAAPFSEPETRAVRDVLHRYTHKIIAYIHVHVGASSPDVFKGDAVLYPKGYTDAQTDDDKYVDLKAEIDDAMRRASFQVYSVAVDTLHSWYGKVSGTSVDYASSVYGIPYAMEFVMQMYDDGPTGEQLGSNRGKSAEQTGNIVLDEVWRRVFDVVVKNIWNSFHSNEV